MRLALASAFIFMSCEPAVPGSASTSHRQAIVGGGADVDTTAVFLLDLRFDTGEASICTAVLISPRVLLTAAHCVSAGLHGASQVTVKATAVANDSNLHASDFIAVTQMSSHPSFKFNDSASPYDIALLQLERAASGSVPALQRSLPAALTGKSIRLVGYGRTQATASDSATRRSVEVPVSTVTGSVIQFGTAGLKGICSGDSGGPSFFRDSDAVERVIGIHSNTRSAQCGLGTDIRVDQHLAFIDAFVASHDAPSCAADGRCSATCTPRDPDCACLADGVCEAQCPVGTADPDCTDCGANGVCAQTLCPAEDEDCLPDGAPCHSSSECGGKQCLPDARGISFCTRACGPTSSACASGMACFEGQCRMPAAAEAVTGGCTSAPWLALLAWGAPLFWVGRRRRRTTMGADLKCRGKTNGS